MVERNNIHWNEKHTLGKVQVIFKVLTLIQLQAFWLAVFHALPFIIMQCNAFVAGQLLQGSPWLGKDSHNLGIEFEKDIMKDISLNKQGIFLFLQLIRAALIVFLQSTLPPASRRLPCHFES